MRLLVLAIALATGCGGRASSPAPTVPAPPPPRPKVAMSPVRITLEKDQRNEIGDGLTLHYESLVIEEIAAGGPGYPAGSGITLVLVAEGAGAPQRQQVSLLSEGYDSHPTATFGRYRVTLIDVEQPMRDARVILKIERDGS